jgi:hypothetical protein
LDCEYSRSRKFLQLTHDKLAQAELALRLWKGHNNLYAWAPIPLLSNELIIVAMNLLSYRNGNLGSITLVFPYAKSTSGMIMTLEGPHSWWPLSWASRKQTSTARSLREAEMVSLGAGLFLEALPMQELLETVFCRQVELVCYQDNPRLSKLLLPRIVPNSGTSIRFSA